MAVHDISLSLHPNMVVYEGDPAFVSETVCTIEADGYTVRRLSLGSHTGTHLDAPAHFQAGAMTVDEVPFETLCGPVRVLDVRQDGLAIDRRVLKRQELGEARRVLLRTESGWLLDGPFSKRHAHLTVEGAEFLRERTQVRLVGIDTLSIEAEPCPGFPVHHALLGGAAPIVVLEGVDLRGVPAGDYDLVCLPLRIRGGDAAPARAFLYARDACVPIHDRCW
jgi:arylformamidase